MVRQSLSYKNELPGLGKSDFQRLSRPKFGAGGESRNGQKGQTKQKRRQSQGGESKQRRRGGRIEDT